MDDGAINHTIPVILRGSITRAGIPRLFCKLNTIFNIQYCEGEDKEKRKVLNWIEYNAIITVSFPAISRLAFELLFFPLARILSTTSSFTDRSTTCTQLQTTPILIKHKTRQKRRKSKEKRMAGRIINTSAYLISSILSSQLADAFTPATLTTRISTKSSIDLFEIRRIGPLAALNRNSGNDNDREIPRPFGDFSLRGPMRDSAVRSLVEANSEVESVESTIDTDEDQEKQLLEQRDQKSTNILSAKLSELTGTIDEDRLAFPELVSGEVPRTFR